MVDKNGAPVKKGDKVTLAGVIESIAGDDDHCMVRIECLQAKMRTPEGKAAVPDVTDAMLVPCNVAMIAAANGGKPK